MAAGFFALKQSKGSLSLDKLKFETKKILKGYDACQ